MDKFLNDCQTLKSRNVIDRYKIGEKTFRRLIEHFGIKWKSFPKSTGKETVPERMVRNFLEQNKISFTREFPFEEFFIDFKIGNLFVEIQGDYWHCNPTKYPDNYFHKQIKKTAKQIRNKDKVITEKLKNMGFEVKRLWESEVMNKSFAINKITAVPCIQGE